ncbi:Signal transduction histidine-protein kinase BarA [compost metagenome]
MVELQGGMVFLNSIVGTGSDFYFRLPFGKVSPQVSQETQDLQSNLLETQVETGKGVRILVVEDNPINQLLVIKLLERRGYDTTVAENGRIALAEYENKDFDIILMDLQMPELDGYETTRIIREMEGEKGTIPIVAMTAHTIKGELEKCANIGMNDYISKPFDSKELYQKIEMLVGSTAGGL